MFIYQANKSDHDQQPKKQPLHHTIQTQFSHIIHHLSSSSSNFLDHLKNDLDRLCKKKNNDQALSALEIKKRMAGIPVYKIANYSGDYIRLYRGETKIEPNFVSRPDADDFLSQTKHLAPDLPTDLRVFDIPLSDFVEGEYPMRLVPESLQIKNAIQEKHNDMAGSADEIFSGVPVFQSDSLTLIQSNTGKQYCPAFLRKEDLEDAMLHAVPEPGCTEGGLKDDTLVAVPHIIKVSALEDIIQEMKDSSTSKSNDVFFVGPGITSFTWLNEQN